MGNEMRDLSQQNEMGDDSHLAARSPKSEAYDAGTAAASGGRTFASEKAKAIVFIHITPINTTLVAFCGIGN